MESRDAKLAAGDESIGPVLESGADLTVTFQMFFFTMFPAIFLILVTPIYVHKAIHKKPCVQSGRLLWAKLAFAFALAGINVTSLILWATSPALRTDATLAATVLNSVGSLCIIFLVYTEHLYSLRPSTFVSVFLSITLLLDAAETRSYFRRQDMETFGGLSICAILFKVIILSLEEASKRRLAKSEAKFGKEAVSGFWNRSLFIWLNSTMLLGFQKVLRPDELQDMGPEFNSERLYGTFVPHWDRYKKNGKHALVKALLRVVRWEYSLVSIPRLFFSGFTLAQPFLFQRVIAGTEEGGLSLDAVGGLIGATALIYFGLAVSKGYSEHLIYRVVTFTRGILVTALFNKTLSLTQDQLDESAAVTLMSTDLSSVEVLTVSVPKICVGIIDLGVGVYILSIFLGASAFLVLLPAFVAGLITSWVTKWMGVARRDWNKAVEIRVAETSRVLSQIKSIKATGLAPLMERKLSDLQTKEIRKSLKERHLRVSLHCMESFSSTVAPVIVIAGGIFWTRFSNKLSTSELFTSLSLVAIISQPFARLLTYIPFSVGGYAGLRRIEDYLLLEEHLDTRHDCPEAAHDISKIGKSPELDPIQLFEKFSRPRSPYGVELVHATFIGPNRRNPVLRDVNLKFKIDQVNMVVGPVGCGKTALLKAIIGEITLNDGFVVVGPGSVGYCAQTPWLQNISIRDSIVAQSEWNSIWYHQILEACALDEDIRKLSEGDKTLVGAGGNGLSGGQKHRVALARAIYSRPSIIVLDDVLSSLDVLTSQTVMSRIFGSSGILSAFETTVILTTNILEHLSLADAVFKFGHPGSVEPTTNDFRELSRDSKLLKWLKQRPQERTEESTTQINGAQVPAASAGPSDEAGPARRTGDLSLYTYYLKASGFGMIVLWLLTLAMTVVGDKMPAIYVRIWAEKDPYDTTYFIGFAVLSIFAVALTGVSLGFYYFKIVPKSSESLHSGLLETMMRAKLWVLTTTHSGSILNRFSQDMTQIGQLLPMAFMEVCYLIILAATHVAVIAAGATYAAAIVPVVLLFIYFIQFYYLRTSRQMRHLDLEAKAPLYTHFTETASGMHHIRAYKWQAQFIWQALTLLDFSQRPYYMMFCIQRWLQLIVDLAVMSVAVIVVSFALVFPHTTSGPAIGLALLNIVTFSDAMAVLVSSWAKLETSLGAVARTKWFNTKTPLEQDATENSGEKMSGYWPLYGRIDFMDVTAKYNGSDESAHPVLNHVSATIEPGEKVGVVGRTGSGKSSFLLAILNFLDYTGTVSIDGRDVRTIPQDYLRNRITTITQDGVELSGSVRINVDPFDEPESTHRLSDETLEETLATVGLWDRIRSRGGLDASFSSMGLSHGQKQLLCLARAILHKQCLSTRIVLADEVSSRVNDETAIKIREIMANAFSTCTVITVAHRLETVEDSDLILELEGGNLLRTRRKEADD